MDFEVFIGDHRKKYYVYDSGKWDDVEQEVCRRTKEKRGTYKCITAWIVRGVKTSDNKVKDYLYLTKVPGAEKKLAAVRA